LAVAVLVVLELTGPRVLRVARLGLLLRVVAAAFRSHPQTETRQARLAVTPLAVVVAPVKAVLLVELLTLFLGPSLEAVLMVALVEALQMRPNITPVAVGVLALLVQMAPRVLVALAETVFNRLLTLRQRIAPVGVALVRTPRAK
jgi:hypothetical protein